MNGVANGGIEVPPLVGRGAELGLIQEALGRAQQSQGSIVFASGEAGIGKTRLCRELLSEASARSMRPGAGDDRRIVKSIF